MLGLKSELGVRGVRICGEAGGEVSPDGALRAPRRVERRRRGLAAPGVYECTACGTLVYTAETDSYIHLHVLLIHTEEPEGGFPKRGSPGSRAW